MTVKGDQGYVDGLLRERDSAAGNPDRVKLIDAELKRVGGSVPRRGAASSSSTDDQIEA
jgi:hypothetical protein